MYKLGDIVCLKSNPEIKGAVTGIIDGSVIKYIVFTPDGINEWYEDQINIVDGEKEEIITKSECDAFFTSLMLNDPERSSLYAMRSANIEYIPYQFRPVLKMLNSDRHRILIADGVGVGKTIETGIIIQEFEARHMAESVLVICPKPLVSEEKWLREMQRFGENFEQLDGKTLKYCIDECDLSGIWPYNKRKCIIPYSILDKELIYGRNDSNKKCLLGLETPPHFDIVIVDEAHHIRNPNTAAYQAVKYFVDNSDAVVLLTATPIQLGNEDLFVLLNLIRPDYIIDKNVFSDMSEPNYWITGAVKNLRHKQKNWRMDTISALQNAGDTKYGKTALLNNPDYLSVLEKLSETDISDEDRVTLIGKVEKLHTFDSIINRTRRRDIGEFTIRRAHTVAAEFTESQERLYKQVISFQSEIMRILHGDNAVKFLTTTVRRQASSCIYGLVPFIHEILSRHLDEALMEISDDYDFTEVDIDNHFLTEELRSIADSASSQDISEDTKYDNLKKICEKVVRNDNQKIMIFSSFRHTLKYLSQRLTADGYKNAVVDGTVPDAERRALKERFQSVENDDSLDILLFSEVGCEGLDYQFCSVMVNYDLPWNPMKVEQRIGRIDRNGQKSEYVTIYNFITPGTIEADIYERCLLRIGIFEHSVGENEQILGELALDIKNIAMSDGLNEDERMIKIQQVTDNNIRLIKENELLEEHQSDLFSINRSQIRINEEVKKAENYWLSPSRLMNLVNIYLKRILDKDKNVINYDDAVVSLRLSKDNKLDLIKIAKKYRKYSNSRSFSEWMNYLRSDNQYCKLTFYNEVAEKEPNVMFINVMHPLTAAAAQEISYASKFRLNLKCTSDLVHPGIYHFAVFRWKYIDIRNVMELCFVSDDMMLEKVLPELLQTAEDDNENSFSLSERKLQRIEDRQYCLWQDELNSFKKQSISSYTYKKASLKSRFDRLSSDISMTLQKTSDERIRIMKQSELASAERSYMAEIKEYDHAIEKTDIISERICIGQIIVEG